MDEINTDGYNWLVASPYLFRSGVPCYEMRVLEAQYNLYFYQLPKFPFQETSFTACSEGTIKLFSTLHYGNNQNCTTLSAVRNFQTRFSLSEHE